jgi:hypothetical protein
VVIEDQITQLIRAHVASEGGDASGGVEAEAAAIAGLFAWQPIETAPRDGTRFLAHAVSTNAELVIEAWREGDGYATPLDTLSPGNAFFLAQWMPLKSPPAFMPTLPALTASADDKWFAVLEPLKGNISAAIDKVVTTHRELFRDYVGPKAVTLLRDDDLVTRAAENIYPVLPFAIRIVVKEDVFTAFLLKHRGPLIAALQKAQGALPSAPSGHVEESCIRSPFRKSTQNAVLRGRSCA